MRRMQLRMVGKILFTGLLLGLIATGARADKADASELLQGVHEIAAPGLPGPLCLYGPQAFSVVNGKVGNDLYAPVVAASRMGEGRVVAFGHPSYFDKDALKVADTGALMLNAVKWAAGHAKDGKPRIGVRHLPQLLAFLQEHDIAAQALDDNTWLDTLDKTDVVVVPTHDLPETAIVRLQAYLRKGGGLMAAELGWGWLQLNPGKMLVQHGGNRLLASCGLLWADGTFDRTSRNGYGVQPAPLPLCNASDALAAILAYANKTLPLGKPDVAQAAWTVSVAARALPPADTLLRPKLTALENAHQAELATVWQNPARTTDPLTRLLLTMQLERINHLPAQEVRPYPGTDVFPGSIPAGAERVTRTVTVDTSVPEWHSTGLYAAPGEPIAIDMPQEALGKNLHVRIGAHTDALWHLPRWDRAPEISRHFPLTAAHTIVANAFGGAIYIEVPHNSRLGVLAVKIGNAVQAPYFVRGKTDVAEWKAKIRDFPAPWAELQANNIILTVPSTAVHNLDDPEALLAYWDEVAHNTHTLYSAPQRNRPERYCVDKQISAGYMHSGYPIMTGSDVAAHFTDVNVLRGKEGIQSWGFYHEIGHNFQVGAWTFAGTGEVTNNLNSLFCEEHLNGITPDDYGRAHSALKPLVMQQRLAKYIAAGTPFAQWQNDPWLALTMYIQLRRAFGWEAFEKTFASYYTLPPGERPRSEEEQHDRWMTQFSRTVGKNLAPFFQAWGVPTSEKARAALADLPAWMPADFPAKPIA